MSDPISDLKHELLAAAVRHRVPLLPAVSGHERIHAGGG